MDLGLSMAQHRTIRKVVAFRMASVVAFGVGDGVGLALGWASF
jgi:hypothetical protein